MQSKLLALSGAAVLAYLSMLVLPMLVFGVERIALQ